MKQILGFVHATSGEFRSTQVKHLARDIIEVIEATFPKSITFERQVPSDLWPVQGNATQIHQVLLNLCVNARDAMPQGGTLRLTAANRQFYTAEAAAIPGAQPGAWLMLEVADTGSGIPPDVLERIWTPFFTTKPTGKGTGLGLATVRGIVAGHHGFIELDPKVGHGTTFRVYLPAVASESTQRHSATPFASPGGHGELLLVVDDEAPIRDIATAILTEHGFRVVACADGLEALELFATRASEFSLILTDVDMPRLGGVALARAALQIRPDIRLVGMSGLSRNQIGGGELQEIRRLAHGFLNKPFRAEDLLNTVHQLLHPPATT